MTETPLTGTNFIDGRPSAEGERTIRAERRTPGAPLEPTFAEATSNEIERAAQTAAAAFESFAAVPPTVRADLLDRIAQSLEDLGDDLLQRAHDETALPIARLVGERARTCGQLRMFANILRDGKWVDARIESADPDRPGTPKPDLRRMMIPIGPVAVFGASNFPLAFSVAGGDTASALAVGCPVIVKAHPGHPGTSEMAARSIVAALQEMDLPSGAFAMLHGGVEVGRSLVQRPEIEAVAFTGSRQAGRALFDLAAARPRPIPVFAEMGSVNPVFVLPGATTEKVAVGYADSLALGVGQFCTNPGVLVGLASPEFDAFVQTAARTLREKPAGTMLNDGIQCRYRDGLDQWASHEGLQPVVAPTEADGAKPALYATTAAHFVATPEMREELFGPAAIVVRCDSLDEMRSVATILEGQLTATVHFADQDQEAVRKLLPSLTRIAGRLIANGFPTGVEVNSAMQHGGPYPATTDARFTSVGTAAIERFVRPIAYQSFPPELLPAELR